VYNISVLLESKHIYYTINKNMYIDLILNNYKTAHILHTCKKWVKMSLASYCDVLHVLQYKQKYVSKLELLKNYTSLFSVCKWCRK
jgi:type II restriction/modification system DNA methylase subunit YeeA